MDIKELCFHLRNRRRMYLMDDRFPTMIAFVEGFCAAFNESPLAGFQEFIEYKLLNRRSSVHWPYIIASTRVPDLMDLNVSIDCMPREAEMEVADLTLDLIEEFLELPDSGLEA
ncbi:hypothetical protein [Streptomyces sp. NPDC086787]|uniref:hypothetical protein n=1 Tax=Streptomyces sp. NPDC086787 TaxID=3365759 RepID=UPI00381D8E5C